MVKNTIYKEYECHMSWFCRDYTGFKYSVSSSQLRILGQLIVPKSNFNNFNQFNNHLVFYLTFLEEKQYCIDKLLIIKIIT